MDADKSEQHRFRIHPSAKIGHVSLNVSDIQRSLDFYQSVLGFRIVGRSSKDRTLLSSSENLSYLVELSQAKDGKSQAAKMAGLYHFAILLPERKYLADMLLNLSEKRAQVHFDGLADHLVSESIYIRDPDFNGIEIYRDRPALEWKWDGNRVQMATERLDTDDLLKESTEKGWKEMPAKTVIGHIHLHVRDLTNAMKFYHEVMGLNFTATYPGAYFFAAGRYHHHVATNTWLGSVVTAASPESVGMHYFSIELPSREEFENMARQLSRHNITINDSSSQKSVFVQDRDGITILLQYK